MFIRWSNEFACGSFFIFGIQSNSRRCNLHHLQGILHHQLTQQNPYALMAIDRRHWETDNWSEIVLYSINYRPFYPHANMKWAKIHRAPVNHYVIFALIKQHIGIVLTINIDESYVNGGGRGYRETASRCRSISPNAAIWNILENCVLVPKMRTLALTAHTHTRTVAVSFRSCTPYNHTNEMGAKWEIPYGDVAV